MCEKQTKENKVEYSNYRIGIRIAKICALTIPSFLAIATFIWQINSFFLRKTYLETLLKNIHPKEYPYITDKLYSLFENNAFDSLEFILSIIGIAVSVWIGLNIYNALERKELDSFAIDMKSDLEIKIEELNKFQSDTIQKTISELKDNSDLQLLLINMLSVFSINSTSDHYIDYFGNASFSNWDSATIKTIINTENALSKISKMTSDETFYKIEEYVDSAENELLKVEEVFKKNGKISYGYFNFKLGELSYYKGNAFFQMRQKNEIAKELFKKAICYYSEAKKLDNELRAIENGIGISYLRLVQLGENDNNKNINEAIKNFELVLERIPNFTQAIRSLGASYEKVDRLDDAISQYKKEIVFKPNSYFAYTCLASAYLKKIDKEINFLNRHEIYSSNNYSFSEEQFNEFNRLILLAEEELKNAIQINSSKVDTYYRFGQICTIKIIIANGYNSEKEKNNINNYKEEAIKQFQKCDKLFLNNQAVKFHERNLYEVLGDVNKAYEINMHLISGDQELREKIYKDYLNI